MAHFVFYVLFAGNVHAQPWNPEAIWSREGLQDSSRYGAAVLALGDQNDDGFNDWAVWAMGTRGGTLTDSAYIEFFHGGNPPSDTPYMTIRPIHGFEAGIRGALDVGDINGDGYIDWYVFVGYINNPDQRREFNFYYGGPSADLIPDFITTTPVLSLFYPIGDFNGDGFDDLFLTNSNDEYADIYYGGDPFDTLPDWHRSVYLGIPSFGDLNGDGFSDFVDDAFGDNYDIYLGGNPPDTLPAYDWALGHAATGVVHDLNGDGYDEQCFAARGFGQIFWGAPSLDPDMDIALHFPCGSIQDPGGPMGFSSAGDLNSDGYSDLIMYSLECGGQGLVTVHLGGPWLSVEPVLSIWGWGQFNLIDIYTAAGLGDVNGDSVDDFAIGAFDDLVFTGWRGKAVVIAGDSTIDVSVDEIRPELPDEISVSIYPNPFNAETTLEFYVPANERDLSLSIFNLVGQSVYEHQLTVNQPVTRFHYDGRDSRGLPLSSGLYFAQLRGFHTQQTAKLIVMR